MAENHHIPNLYFKDPYFDLGFPERIFAKAFSFALSAALAAFSLFFLFSGNPRLFWLSILLSLFLADLLLQLVFGRAKIDSRIIQKIERAEAINVSDYFRVDAKKFLESAVKYKERESSKAPSFKLLHDLLNITEVKTGLDRLGIDKKLLREKIESKIKENLDSTKTPSDPVENLAIRAFEEAVKSGETLVSPVSIFLGLLRTEEDALRETFSAFNFSEEDFHNAIIFGRLSQGLGQKMLKQITAAQGRRLPRRFMNRAWTARPTYYLDSVSQDWTNLARAGVIGFLVGHETEYRSLVNILSRETKNNALLIGQAGVGKETIIAHLAYQIIRDEVPPKLFDKRLVAVNISSVGAGAKNAAEVQERFARLIEEVLLAGNIILYFPDIHNLKIALGEGLSAFELLKTVFERSEIPTIGTTTPQDFRNIIEKDQSFTELFEALQISEISEEEAVRFLTYESYILEAEWKIVISYGAIKQSVKLAKRFLRPKPLPSSAIDLLQEALADAKNRGQEVLTEEAITQLVSQKVKVPIEVAAGKEAEKLLDLEAKIHQRLINQEEAVKAVSSAMRQYRAGLAREKGPIATFLFIGPTGVGKTELAKTLAAIYFGGEEEVIRFDMVEYQDPKSTWNFIGSPDGEIPGNLTESIKKKPYTLLLLDEFEKAHYDILELFMPLFDEGRLKDSLGNIVDFTNTIIICTSNAHSNFIKEGIEKGTPISDIAIALKKKLTEYFKPELLNRFDDIIVFRQLTEDEIKEIAKLQLLQLAKRLEEEQGIQVAFTGDVAQLLANIGWDPVFGARPLRGVIREKIREVLAQEILKQNLQRGSRVLVKVSGKEFIFENL